MNIPTLRALAEYFNLPATAGAAWSKVSRMYAKDLAGRRRFVEDSGSKQQRATPAMREAVER